jgi:hypothetical protein
MCILNWLNEWYKSNCNGDWEHTFGIRIDTLDNPGWAIDIDLNETTMEDKAFVKIANYKDDNDFIFCDVENNVFRASGDPDKLVSILKIFKDWAEKNK